MKTINNTLICINSINDLLWLSRHTFLSHAVLIVLATIGIEGMQTTLATEESISTFSFIIISLGSIPINISATINLAYSLYLNC